jgi:cell division protein FtsB
MARSERSPGKNALGKGRPGVRLIRRIVLAVLAIVALIFVVQGGEFGTWDLLRQQSRKSELIAAIDSLERDIDSLLRLKEAVETDRGMQERIARERFGYVRGEKEILYRFTDARRDTAGTATEP